MKKYSVTYTIYGQMFYNVEANSFDDAIEKADMLFNLNDAVLSDKAGTIGVHDEDDNDYYTEW